jgi:hypothetical protein
MKAIAAKKPMDGNFRTWSDGRCVHLLIQLTGGNVGPNPVTMHAKAELAPARAAVRKHLVSGDDVLAGDPVAIEALATRVGAFGLFRRIGHAARGAFSLATAPVRALGGAGVNVLKATGNVAKGVEGATALTEFATRPLAWRPHKKHGGATPAAGLPPDQGQGDQSASQAPPDSDSTQADQEGPMNDDTSGSPRPQFRHVMGALGLLKRAQHNPKAAKHVQTIAKAAAQGHPGAMVAQAAIAEARKQQRQQQVPHHPMPAATHPTVFPAWARGAA